VVWHLKFMITRLTYVEIPTYVELLLVVQHILHSTMAKVFFSTCL